MATNTFTTRDLRLRDRRTEQVRVRVQWAKQPKTTTGHKGGNGAQRVAHKQRTQQCNTCSKPSTMATTTTTPLGGGQCVVVCVMAMPHMPHVPQQWVAAGGVCGGVVLCHGGGVWWHRRCLWLWLGVCHMASRPNASRTMPNTCSNTALSWQDSSAASSSPHGVGLFATGCADEHLCVRWCTMASPHTVLAWHARCRGGAAPVLCAAPRGMHACQALSIRASDTACRYVETQTGQQMEHASKRVSPASRCPVARVFWPTRSHAVC